MAQPMARPARGGAEVTSHPHGACLVLHFDMCDACRVRELEAELARMNRLSDNHYALVGATSDELAKERERGDDLQHIQREDWANHQKMVARAEAAEAEMAQLREALQIAIDMFCGEGWTEAEQGRIAQVRAALRPDHIHEAREVSELIGTPPKKPAWRPPPERECE